MRKFFFGLVLFSALSVLSGCGNQVAPLEDNSPIILFYSTACPHCQVVEKYIADNNIKDKVQFSQHEVSSDQASAALMLQRQQACPQFDPKSVGAVPFLWTADKCYFGQDEIIQFFKDKTGAQN